MFDHVAVSEQTVETEQREYPLDRMLKALGDPTRLAIFDLLMEGTQCNCEIAAKLGLSLSLISHHMQSLRQAGLIQGERDPNDARWIYYTVDRDVLQGLLREMQRLFAPARIKPRAPCCGPRGSSDC
jgi:ArsR family transcriptional regulator, arsenate/arsenite/antimonite-responsive transcriptional repressor